MKIKEAKGSATDIEELESLQLQAGLNAKARTAIEHQIKTIRAGNKGEREAAYEIDFHHGPSRNWAVIHDLRIEHDGLVAQIDHLLIGRFLDIWVCETKHFKEGMAINEQGEFTRFYQGKPSAMPSPLEQNRRHVLLLERILQSDKITLPTRLGIKLRPRLHSVILVSKDARITRPKTRVDGIDHIVKSDQLRSHIERAIDDESAASSLVTMGKLLSSEALEEFARQVARLHRPLRRDWAKSFGLSTDTKPSDVVPTTVLARSVRATLEQDAVPDRPPSVTRDDASKPVVLSTSKLGAAMGIPNVAATLERLRTAGYLQRINESDQLTERGIEIGGRFVEKGRFGPYFVWPNTLRF